jgi:hypothetical protein
MVYAGAVILPLVAPGPLAGQAFKAFCDSPAMTWCFNAIALDYVETLQGNGYSDYAFSATGYFTGSAFALLPLIQWGPRVFPPGWNSGGASRPVEAFGTVATHTMGVNGFSGFAPTATDWSFYWDTPPGAPVYGEGFCGETGRLACHIVPVPEPASWTLMLGGLLALGLVAWRRRGESHGSYTCRRPPGRAQA